MQEFVRNGVDLLRPFFYDEKRLRFRLRLVAEIAQGQDQLWSDAGCDAFRALADGLDYHTMAYQGARKWAQLIEPFLRHLCITLEVKSKDKKRSIIESDLNGLLTSADLNPADRPNYSIVPGKLGQARADQPTDLATKRLACVSASFYRNKHAHDQWPDTGWRERIEIAETVLVTLITFVEIHPEIERLVVFQQALKETSEITHSLDFKEDFCWRWEHNGTIVEGTSEQLADRVLDQIRGDVRRFSICGPRGVGLSYLGDLLAKRCAETAKGTTSPFLLHGEPSAQCLSPLDNLGAEQSTGSEDAFMIGLLGTNWSTWWLQTALERDWLGIVVDGLERLDDTELTWFISRFEYALKKWPRLRVVTISPEDLPASGSGPRPRILGKLRKGPEFRIFRRLVRDANTDQLESAVGHPATLGYWLARGAGRYPLAEPADTVVRNIIAQDLAYDHDDRWYGLNPDLRPAASLLTLNVLYRVVEALDEEERPRCVTRLEVNDYGRALKLALRDILAWSGQDVKTELPLRLSEAIEDLLHFADDALRDAGFIRPIKDDGRPVWIAHPLTEQCARADGYQEWVMLAWDKLSADDRQALIELAINAEPDLSMISNLARRAI
ncbi:hypothetical protein [uncultured Thiodictyon sp.]|uniref:hypothetical protein n=1 Tax=uncultured Thiodictyon sp. TaxID=1846217 RepID=UPI0025D83443|nr:hypothetical protein [uncultured Thiodictyon sp.]